MLWEAQTEQVQAGDYAPEREADSKQSKSAGGAGCQFKRRIVSETPCSGQDGGHFAATRSRHRVPRVGTAFRAGA